MLSANQTHTKEFFELIRFIGETKSKQEEDKIIIKEIATLKQHFQNDKSPLKLMKEYMIRALYCEMLGHEAGFSYFQATKLTSSKSVLEKRVGYLAITLCVPKDHELVLLIIACLQNDLTSTNYLIVCAALNAASKIVNEETIPALLPSVLQLRKHKNPIVRKKTVSLLHTFYLVQKDSVPNLMEYAKEALCDHDPAVMGVSMCLFHDLSKDERNLPELKELALHMVNILKQIVDHRLAREFDYHRIPAPWIQIKILQVLAVLGREDKIISEAMYDTLRETMQRGDNALNIGHAVVYEAVKTITSIYPNNLLLENAASAISRFITSANHNLKYLGIVSLTEIVKISPKYASQHQMVVIDCLEDPDDTIRRRTLSLLYTMCNPNNVNVIVKKLIEFARKSMDSHMREELIQRISNLAERFCHSIFWYIDTMNTCFEIGSEYVPPRSIQNMVTVIAEGIGTEESAQEDDKMRVYCVDTFYDLTEKKSVIHDLHLQVIAWVLGEYGYLSAQHSQTMIAQRLCDLIERQCENDDTKGVVILALMKLVAQTGGHLIEGVQEILNKYAYSKNVDLQQRCYEFQQLVASCTDRNRKPIMDAVLPKDGSCEDLDVDDHLSWLNKYVQQAVNQGARGYLQDDQRDQLKQIVEVKRSKELNITPYAATNTANRSSSSYEENIHSTNVGTYTDEQKPTSGLDPNILLKKPRRWSEWDDEPTPSSSSNNNLNPSSSSSSTNGPSSSSSTYGDYNNNNSSYEPSSSTYTPKKLEEPVVKKVDAKTKKFVEGIFGDESGKGEPLKKKVQVKRRAPSIKKEEIPILSDPVVTQQQQQLPSVSMMDNDPPQQNVKQQPVQDLLSLDDFMGSGTPTNYNAMNSPIKDGDIFGGMNTVSQEQQPTSSSSNDEYNDLFSAPVQRKSSSGTKNFLDDLWNAPAPTLQQAPLNPSSSSMSHNLVEEEDEDFAGSAFMLKPQAPRPKAIPVMGEDGYLLPSNVKRQPALLARLDQSSATKANTEPIGLCRDDLINIEHYKYWKDDAIVIAMVFSTERGYSLTNITCRFQPPTKFSLSFESDAPGAKVTGNSIVIPRLDMGVPVVVLCELKLTSFGFGLAMMGSVMYSDNERQTHNQTLSVQMNVVDVMRHLHVAESDIEKLWGSVSQDFIKKTQVQGSYSIQSYVEKLERDLKIKVIQIKGQEAIGAAKLINIEEKVVFYGAIKNNGVVLFSTKVKDKPTNEMLSKAALKVLV